MSNQQTALNAERERLEAQREGREDWGLWGPYLAERAWGTVREDYSPHGTAWEWTTTRPALGPTAGTRTASAGSATPSSDCASPWPCGTARTRSLRNAPSA